MSYSDELLLILTNLLDTEIAEENLYPEHNEGIQSQTGQSSRQPVSPTDHGSQRSHGASQMVIASHNDASGDPSG